MGSRSRPFGGIRKAELERIFEPFYRGSGRVAGAGLGLPISSQLAELLGGSLAVENDPAGGAVAHLTLPIEVDDGS